MNHDGQDGGWSEPVRKRKRDKRQNTPEFNKKWKQRRAKAKHDAKARKRNQRR